MKLIDKSTKKVILDLNPNIKILIVEGYESVGKTRLIENLKVPHKRIKIWKPNYSKMTTDILPPGGRYILNMTLFDLLSNDIVNIGKNDLIVIDRGLLSSIIYSIIKSQNNNYLTSDKFIEFVKSLYTSGMVFNLYIEHATDSSAHFLYEESRKREDNDDYDEFDGFVNYLNEYKNANSLFKFYLDKVCSEYYAIISSLDYKVIF